MTTTEIIAQVIGIFAMIFNLLSYQQKTRNKAIIFQLFGTTLFTVNFLMLGAMVGGLLNLVGAIRAIIFINKEKLRADHIAWQIGFVAVYFASYILTFTVFGKEPTPFNFIIEFLPLIGMIATTISYRFTDAKAIRRFGLISSPAWLVYNIANLSVGAILCEVLSLGSIIIGIIRLDRKDKQ
ncbi:MAG: YgjV family protein [Clostridia bacterium]|nr:YgjV family protein [Clostridia bacterium]